MNINEQFELLKKDKIFIWQIENLTDEMIWYAIEHNLNLKKRTLNKDMIFALLKKSSVNFDLDLLKNLDIPEDIWIEGIRNSSDNFFLSFDNFLQIACKYANMTENIALEICLKYPLYYTNKDIKQYIPDNKKEMISDIFFDGIRNNKKWHFELPNDLPISKEQWEWIVDKEYLLHCTGRIENYIAERNDVPEFVRINTLKKHCYLKEWGKISKDELIFWLNTYKDEMDDWYCRESIKYYIHCDDMESVMRECGWFIQYWKNQSAKLCKAAIECDPHNIQYIKKPTDKLVLYALSLDKTVEKYVKKTKAVCDFLNIEYKELNPYPSKYYLVKFKEDLCDEDNLIKVCVIEGKDMEEFLNKTTSLSFGNLYDDEEREVKKIAKYEPITEEELNIIRKFGLDDLESGYFSNLD